MVTVLATFGEWCRQALSWLSVGLAWTMLVAGIAGGLVGVFVPVVPGAVVVLLLASLFAWLEPGWLSVNSLLILVGLTVLDRIVDFGATAMGTKWFGGSKWGMFGAIAGGVVGLFFGIIGLVLGPILGAAICEFAFAKRGARESARSGVGAGVGFGISMAGRFAVYLAMVGVIVFDLLR